MRRSVLLLIALLLALAAPAYDSESQIDSLTRALSTAKGKEKLEIYRQLVISREWEADIQTTLDICDAWIDYAQLQGDIDSEESARNRKLTVIYNDEDWDRLHDEAVVQQQWMKAHDKWDSYYKAWRDLCESYSYRRMMQTALDTAEAMQKDAEARGNLLGLALAYQQMGLIYDFIDPRQTVQAFEKSTELMRKIPDTEENEQLSCYYYLAQALDQSNAYAREFEICRLWKETLDKIQEKKWEKRNDVHYMECYLWTSSALIGTNRLDDASAILADCERLAGNIGDPYLDYQLQVHRASLAFKQGDIKTAEAYSDQFAPMMEQDHWQHAMKLRGLILLAAGRDREAAQFYLHVFEQRDSTYTKDMRRQLDEFNTKFQLSDVKMRGRIERQRFFIIIGSIVLIALLIIIYLIRRSAKRLRQKNDELIIANARAEESSRMKTNFIQQISHEIRTPLNILSGFTQVITTPGMTLDDETRTDINQRITENTERITSLVNKMLELSDANSQAVIERTDQVPAFQIAVQAVDNSGITTAEHLHFDLRLDEGLDAVQLLTDTTAATRALVLLLDNAIKFTRRPEALHHDGPIAKTESASLRLSLADGCVAFTVEDSGIGVPPAEAEHIFEEFVQLDEYYDGTGIGLTVARSLAHRLGGDITLDATYTGGARFTLTLPQN